MKYVTVACPIVVIQIICCILQFYYQNQFVYPIGLFTIFIFFGFFIMIGITLGMYVIDDK